MFHATCLIRNNFVILCFLGFLAACGGGSKNNSSLPGRDTTAPNVVQITPSENQRDVQSSQLISLTLNETVVNDTTVNITVEQVDELDNSLAFIPMKKTISYNDKTFTLTFSPETAFTERFRYRVTISNINDSSQNTMATKIWYFSTKTPPSIETIQPNILDNPISRSTDKVTILFSEQMNQQSVENGITLSKVGVNANINLSMNYNDESIVDNNTGKASVKGKAIFSLPVSTLLDPSSQYEIKILPTVTDSNGVNISTSSIIKTFTTSTTSATGTRPDSPLNPKATVAQGSTNITISWDKVTGATDYNVYVSKNGSSFTVLNLTHPYTTNSYVHTATFSDEYEYAITAIANNIESKFAKTTKVSSFTNLTPTDFTATPGAGEVILNWTPTSGLSYTLVYSDNSITDKAITYGSLPYVHQGLTNGTKYTYTLTATDATQSGSSVKTATPLGVIDFVAADKITAIANNASVKIQWPDIASAANFSYYNLYAVENPTARTNTCTLLSTNIKSSGGATVVFTHDTNTVDACSTPLAWPIINGKSYTYLVSVVNKNGSEGAKITSATVTPIVAPAIPVITNAIPGNKNVKLIWDAISGLKYNVYINGSTTPIVTGLTFSGTVGNYKF